MKFEAEGESKKITKDRMADIDEILNYRQAMNHAVSLLSDLPLCQTLNKRNS